MPACAAGSNVQFAHGAELIRTNLHLTQQRLAILGDPAQSCIAHCARLLVDFLQHKMREAVFFRHAGVPGNVVGGAHHRLARKVSEAHAGGGDDGHLSIIEKQDLARMGKDGGSIGGDKIFVVPYSDDRRRSVARHHDLVTLSFQNH